MDGEISYVVVLAFLGGEKSIIENHIPEPERDIHGNQRFPMINPKHHNSRSGKKDSPPLLKPVSIKSMPTIIIPGPFHELTINGMPFFHERLPPPD